MTQPRIQRRTQQGEGTTDATGLADLPSFLNPNTGSENGIPADDEEQTDESESHTLSMHELSGAQLSDVDDHAMTVLEQVQRMDMERLKVAAQLVNTFNHAIQVQAGRNDWNEHDYASFIVALRSIDRIGYDAQQQIKKRA